MATKQTIFIESIAGKVIEAVKNTGLFPSVMIAQAILESAWGKSPLSSKCHNYFGIKADNSWRGKQAPFRTREVINGEDKFIMAPFRVYDSIEEGFKDRVLFLQKNSNYKRNNVFSAATPFEQAIDLQKAHYATDPKYAERVSVIIRQYGLEQYDQVKKKE